MPPSRPVLEERTNLDIFAQQRPSLTKELSATKRPAPTQLDECTRKRVKLDKAAVEDDQRRLSSFRRSLRWRTAYSLPNTNLCSSSRTVHVTTRPILESFVSSNHSDIYKCESSVPGAMLTPPYACAYTNSAKRGGPPLLAVATEEGSVNIWETSRRDPWDPALLKTTFYPHKTGTFFVSWSNADDRIVTCAGDQVARVSSPATSQVTNTLRGHEGTVRCAAWDPSHSELLSTGGRDGGICLWDLRVNNAGHGGVAPVISIQGAHEPTTTKSKSKKVVPKSVTSLVYGDSSTQLISSGSADGILRCWDIRFMTSSKKAPKTKSSLVSHSSSIDATTIGSRRARGLLSVVRGTGPTSGVLFALSVDSRIHTYDLNTLTPLGGARGRSYQHPEMKINTFYVGMALSSCGRWIASGSNSPTASTGSSGSSGGRIFLFDVSRAASPFGNSYPEEGVQIKLGSGEVGSVDWGDGMLATCVDDGTVRVWRPDVERHGQCIDDPENMKWDWSW